LAEQNVSPTKGNLLASKKTLELSNLGFDLLDRKRNVLVRELLTMVTGIKNLQKDLDQAYAEAYTALKYANIAIGDVQGPAYCIPEDHSISITNRSVMGAVLPTVKSQPMELKLYYGLLNTNSLLDVAYIKFNKAKELTVKMAELESGVFRLATAIRSTQRRTNALQNIVIPRYTSTVKSITDSLEEKEREEFSRLKVIKTTKAKHARQ